ncbi:MAG: hypothetical protein ACKO8Z_05965 [Prosthecobacter sp.]
MNNRRANGEMVKLLIGMGRMADSSSNSRLFQQAAHRKLMMTFSFPSELLGHANQKKLTDQV